MNTEEAIAGPDPEPSLRDALRQITQPIQDFTRASAALKWGINFPYFLEGVVYFGVLTLLTKFLSEDVALGDVVSGWVVAALTGGITGSMLLLGEVADRWGLRRALVFSLVFLVAGRLALAAGPTLHLAPGRHGGLFYMDLLAIAFVVVGYGAYQPATYAGVKLYTDKRTAAMGFAMIYAVMNLGSFTAGLLSPPVRRLSAAVFPPSGITGVFWLYVGLTVMALVATLMFVPRRDPQPAASEAEPDTSGPLVAVAPPPRVFSAQWFREHPLSDGKFLFFIFILIPVQTLFAHNWLTLPLYIERAFRHAPYISDNFEFFSNINPLLIFILTPLLAVVTARANVYWMMIVGTAIMAAPSFLLALGPKPALLLVFILVMSVGEALWQPRFLQYVAEIAPPGKTGMYMGVAQFPWFLTKLLTGTYSGWFLQRYCPAQGAQDTKTLWLLYALIASVSPVGLLLAKGWVGDSINNRKTHG